MIPILSGTELSKTYRNKARVVRPLQRVAFELFPGEILGVVGESGCGKSTLLRIISGIERPDSGRLFHNGEEYTGKGPGHTGKFLQMVFQDAHASFDPLMTMNKSLREGARMQSRSMADMSDEISRIMAEVGLKENLLLRRPGELSGGECQRMSIARALLAHARILLCDEITSALDVTTQAQVIRLLLQIRESEGLSIILVSHDPALVRRICDSIIAMKEAANAAVAN